MCGIRERKHVEKCSYWTWPDGLPSFTWGILSFHVSLILICPHSAYHLEAACSKWFHSHCEKRKAHPSLWVHRTQCPAILPSKRALFLLQEMLCIFLSSCPVALSDSISDIRDSVSPDRVWPVKTRVHVRLLGILGLYFYLRNATSNNGNQTGFYCTQVRGEVWKPFWKRRL